MTPGTGGGMPTDGSMTGGAPTASGGAPTTGTGGSGTTITASACGSTTLPFNVLADEANNMTFQSTIVLPDVKVPPSNINLTMDWSALTKDFLGHDLAFQGGLKNVALVVWSVPLTEVARMINESDKDLESKAHASMQFPIDGTVTSAPITSFTSFGGPVQEELLLEYLDPAKNFAFTLMAQAHPTTIGRNVQMIQAFSLDAAATSTTVALTDTSTELDWSANLDTLTPTQVPAAQTDILVDWFSSIAVNSYNGAFVNNQITEVLVGRYDPSINLNDEFLDIELNATELWRGTVSIGSNFNLKDMTPEIGGAAFTGVPAGSGDQWLLGLLCTTCVNPTPWYVTRLETCP